MAFPAHGFKPATEWGMKTQMAPEPEHLPPANVMTKQLGGAFLNMVQLNRKSSQVELASGMGIRLFDHQKLMYQATLDHDRVVGVSARRSGKTFFFLHLLTDFALRFNPKKYPGRDCEMFPGRYLFIMPTLKQAEDVAWPVLEAIAKRVGAVVSQKKLSITFQNGAYVKLCGAREPDSMRGAYADGVLFDEWAYQAPSTWTKVIRAQLVDYKGFAWFFSTPCGRNHFYEDYQNAANDDDWGAFRFPASELVRKGVFSQEELDKYRKDVGDHAYLQEMECDFDAPVHGSYWGERFQTLGQTGSLGRFPPLPDRKVYVHIDLGVHDLMTIWWVQKVDGSYRWVGCEADEGKSLAWVVDQLAQFKTKHDVEYGLIGLPHDAKNREMGSDDGEGNAVPREMQFRRLIKERGIASSKVVRVTPRHAKADRISAMHTILRQSVFNTFDPNVNKGVNALSLYQRLYNEQTQAYSNTPLHNWASHYADSAASLAYLFTGFEERAKRRAAAGVGPGESGVDQELFDSPLRNTIEQQIADGRRKPHSMPSVLTNTGRRR